ncbi:MAG: CHAT domain-containing protein [Vicinamibacteria bacterium]
MARVRLSVATTDWTLRGLPLRGATSGAGRRSASEEIDPFAARLAASGRVEVAAAGVAIPSVRRDREPRRALEIDVEAGRGERVVFMARHPSGAITFHLPSESPRRGARGTARHRFQVPAAAPERRGVVAAGVKFVLLKVADAVAGAALPALARAVETRLWKSRGLVDGWVRVPVDGTWRGPFVALPKGGGSFAAPPKKNLLLVHGIFSNAEAAFAGLATTRGSNGRTFFEQTAALYEGRVFAFNHLTVSRDPAENARALLSSLPPGPTLFDVVTHSRGGVVFRSVIERPDLHGDLARRFRPGRAVLVAAPNEGSPLAAPERLGDLLGWLANVIDYLPDNPFTTGLALVAEGLSWLASNVPGRLPGIAALAPSSAEIAAIQAAPHPAPESLSALVANYEPDDGLAARMADAAVDAFFASANDLVVPSEGGWRLARGLSVPPGQIGCFGPGGNIAGGPGKVHHVNFFAQPAAVDFVSRGLGGAPQGLAPVEPERRLPFREGRRGAQGGSFTATPRPDRGERSAPPADVAIPVVASPDPDRRGSFGETFELTVLDGEPGRRDLRLLAKFRNATRLERVVRGGPGDPLAKIRKTQKEIRAFVDGEKGAPDLPRGRALVDLGTRLFDALFPGEIRRLYDVARAFQHPRRLNVILTSTVDEIADLPWEFAYDSSRKAFVAAEEVNFVRNVETAVPADRIAPRAGPLRILVVVAQPLGTSHLSADAETEVIRSGFRRLLEARLAEVDVLLEATPDALHRALEAEVRPIDVLHFIGHGAFEERKGTAQDPGVGYLLFEDENRRIERLDAPTFRQIVAQRGIRLVFLNACESGRGGITDFNHGWPPTWSRPECPRWSRTSSTSSTRPPPRSRVTSTGRSR